uniref:Transposase n=1 Tax=Heterorhabditis bacteriophora TaxID=37862 RepID=A0A1I7WXX5_HETBA
MERRVVCAYESDRPVSPVHCSSNYALSAISEHALEINGINEKTTSSVGNTTGHQLKTICQEANVDLIPHKSEH